MTIKLFPISCKLKDNSGEKPGEILQLSHSGLFVSLDTPLLVNKTYQVDFSLPLINANLSVNVVVSRTFAQIENDLDKGKKVKHMNELLFKNPAPDVKKSIVHFLANVTHRLKA